MARAGKRDWEKEMNKFKRHPTTSSYKGDILFLLQFVSTSQITLNETTLKLGENDFKLGRNDLTWGETTLTWGETT